MTPSRVKLNVRKLLGFKITANGDGAIAVHSPKIGGKGCPVIEAQADGTSGLDRSKSA
jgi:hypothetical protein